MTTTINTDDILFATVISHGSTIASLRFSGASSYNDVVKHVKNSLNNTLGLITINLRNRSQGWTRSSAVLLTPSRS
jgi:hypothetical protein